MLILTPKTRVQIDPGSAGKLVGAPNKSLSSYLDAAAYRARRAA